MAFPPTFEELIPADHTVRIVDKVINAINVGPLLEAYKPHPWRLQLPSDSAVKSIGLWLCDQYLLQSQTC